MAIVQGNSSSAITSAITILLSTTISHYLGKTDLKTNNFHITMVNDNDRRLSDRSDTFDNNEDNNSLFSAKRIALLQDTEVEQSSTEMSSKLDRTATVKAKYEREVTSLKEQIVSRDEQLLQLRTSLEMRKNEVKNLQTRLVDVEKSCKAETERNSRHIKKIDDINLELKASETKLAAKMEENRVCEKRAQKLRNDLINAEEKLEQLSMTKKRDIEILHNKLSQARRRSSTNTPTSPITTPTPQDELMRLQMEIRDLKDELIDREAEVDFHKREMDLLKFKLETRTLEVDSNNQELARRCQDLLEQNRKSEDVLKELMKSSSEHSQQLIHATEELKEANGKCVKLREQIRKLEADLKDQQRQNDQIKKENSQQKEQSDNDLNRLQTDIRGLKDQLVDRETEADQYKRELQQLKARLEEKTGELDSDNQEYKRRCQTLTEENKRSEQIIEDLRKNSHEHSQQLTRVMDDLKESNCKLREIINELESQLTKQLEKHAELKKDNIHLRQANENWTQQLDAIHQEMNDLQLMSPDERREYESQIEFLNSVIVDMQKKNDDLQVQVATMQVLGPM